LPSSAVSPELQQRSISALQNKVIHPNTWSLQL